MLKWESLRDIGLKEPFPPRRYDDDTDVRIGLTHEMADRCAIYVHTGQAGFRGDLPWRDWRVFPDRAARLARRLLVRTLIRRSKSPRTRKPVAKKIAASGRHLLTIWRGAHPQCGFYPTMPLDHL